MRSCLPACRAVAMLLALLWLTSAHAATRAWLDRDRVEVGETATLNIETDQADARMPAFTELQADFELSGHSSRRGTERVNGVRRERALFAVALKPRRDGLVTVPALAVGGETTQQLVLTVVPSSTAPARAGEPVFIEGEADSQDPYVQQSLGYTLRLYYATPLVSGQLDQPPPEGASMQRVGSDLQFTRDIDGRRYTVVERRFVLVPERSGALTIPGARFEGTGVGDFFDDLLGDGRRALRARSAPRILQVQPVPDAAPQPWLPLHGLELRYLETPQAATAGEAAMVTLEMLADGAAATQLPELRLPPVDGAQILPEPQQVDERFERGRLQTRVTRRFAIVPARAGTLRLPGPRQAWWDVRAGTARSASLPELALDVAAGSGATAPSAADADTAQAVRSDAAPGRGWAWATLAFALLWLATLAWALRDRAMGAGRVPRRQAGEAGDVAAASTATSTRALLRVLQTGDLGEVEAALCALATPPAASVDVLARALADPAQKAALALLVRARWADGEPAAARQALREAFVGGVVWARADAPVDTVLPPLYPRAPR